MIFEDDETLQMYIEESLDHLENIESDLLSIEQAGEDIDEELVNNVFRAAHSIKGGAGFVGLTKIKELAHKIENVLGMIRSREIVPNSDIISTLLKGFDKLHDMITHIESSDTMDIDQHIVSLIGLAEASLPQDKKASLTKAISLNFPDGRKALSAPQFDLDQAWKEGQYVYLAEYDLVHDIHRKNKTPMDVITYLLNSGTVIQSKIDIQAVGTLDDKAPTRIPFYLLFASMIEPEIIPSLFDLDQANVHMVTPEMCMSFSEEPSYADQSASIEQPSEASYETSTKDSFEEKIKNGHFHDQDMETHEGMISPMKPSVAQTSLRVNVSLLDLLMTLAGELVLSRNQLMQAISKSSNARSLEISGQRIDMVTSELQEAIMRTRMQSIGNVFNKFPRVVRDLAGELGKKIELLIEGKGVELDKTIIEAINDPLTHLVRNAADHGIEAPDTRQKIGKSPIGRIRLRAFHEAGQVNIEISDDGRGLDGEKLAESAVNKGLINQKQARKMSDKEKMSLVFLPGFSTASQVTDVSGRGVGMDVVKTNLDKLGGIIDIESSAGKGTKIKIKLPLTLAIIPSQIISVGHERYAIPQVNLDELLRIPAAQVKSRIEKVGDAEVVRLRGSLLPLLNLSKVLDINKIYLKKEKGCLEDDRRQNIADRRSPQSPMFYQEEDENKEEQEGIEADNPEFMDRSDEDRRTSPKSAINIAVVSAGTFKYGLVVDNLRDSEEIVVKPLGRHLKGCSAYAGATIMGDGKVALILDVAGLAQMAGLTSLKGTDRVGEADQEAAKVVRAEKDKISLLIFRNGEDEQCAVALGLVERIEKIKIADIEEVGGKKVIQYRGGSLPLFSLDEVANVKPLPKLNQLEVIVFMIGGREIGLMVTPPVDAVDVAVDIDPVTLKQPGVMGSAIIEAKTTLMINVFEMVKIINPGWFDEDSPVEMSENAKGSILFAEDSAFFRNQVKGFLQEDGYNVFDAEDGVEAWELLNKHKDKINLVLTDIEMPNMNGFELASKIKSDEAFSHLKVVALTSLAGEEDIARGKHSGIDEYQIKLDRERLIETVKSYLGK